MVNVIVCVEGRCNLFTVRTPSGPPGIVIVTVVPRARSATGVNTSVDGDGRDQVPKVIGENDGSGEFAASGCENDIVKGPLASTPVAPAVGVVESRRNPVVDGRCIGTAALAGEDDDVDERTAVKIPPAAPSTARTARSPNGR
jgi:hypothetical protein